MSGLDFVLANRLRAGLPPAPGLRTCGSCGVPVDGHPDADRVDRAHTFSCIKTKRTTRTHAHDGVNCAITACARRAGLAAQMEKAVHDASGRRLRPDSWVDFLADKTLTDVTIQNPAARSNIRAGDRRTLDRAYTLKLAKYAPLAAAEQARFVPLVASIYGELHPTVIKHLKDIAQAAVDNHAIDADGKPEFYRSILAVVAKSIQRGNAHVLRNFIDKSSAAHREFRPPPGSPPPPQDGAG